ncbi:MAG TPA: UDP-N-acetylglucosamine 2-epimerase (non-hydrolyzing), partial [Synergistaceae bacterium]|nr:UDP-N-acetylglucosamine 2-epimerase (non-hydrolyzing) [Synergistaceae bacterium]
MTGKTVVCVVGTRPEAIKMAPVVLALRSQGYFDVKILATGQHAAMLDQALGHFSLTADLNLHIMKERQSLDHITAS